MNKPNMRWAMSLVLAFAVTGLAFSVEEKEEGQEEKVALDQVPAVVKDAAVKAVAGLTLTEAEKEVKGSETVFELKGTAGGKEYEVKVSADGKVLKAVEEKADKEEEADSKGGKEDEDGDDDDDDDDK